MHLCLELSHVLLGDAHRALGEDCTAFDTCSSNDFLIILDTENLHAVTNPVLGDVAENVDEAHERDHI